MGKVSRYLPRRSHPDLGERCKDYRLARRYDQKRLPRFASSWRGQPQRASLCAVAEHPFAGAKDVKVLLRQPRLKSGRTTLGRILKTLCTFLRLDIRFCGCEWGPMVYGRHPVASVFANRLRSAIGKAKFVGADKIAGNRN